MKACHWWFFFNVKVPQNFILLFEFFEFLDLISFEFSEACIDLMDLGLLSGEHILAW